MREIKIKQNGGKKIKSKADSKETKDKIIDLFFEKHLKPIEISKKLKVKMPYITKIIQKDSRYIAEKENRKDESKERHKQSKRNYINKRRQAEKQEYEQLLMLINRDNEYLSSRKKLTDVEFAKWNRGMYEYDRKSSDLVLKKGICVGYSVPKRVSNRISVQ